MIDGGRAGSTSLSGLAAALVFRYSDDEPGSPWRFVLHVDARGDEAQRSALSSILLGQLGGDDVLGLPWVRKPSELLVLQTGPIRVSHGPAGYELHVGEAVELAAARPVETDERVTCIIPGHHRPGTELFADRFTADVEPFRWELAGTCAFATDFAYRG